MLLTSVASFPFDAILTTMMAVGQCSDYLLHALHLGWPNESYDYVWYTLIFNRKHIWTEFEHVHFRWIRINCMRIQFRNNVSRNYTEILCWRHGTKLLFVLHVVRGVWVYKRYEGTPTHHNHAPPLWTTDTSPFHSLTL